MDSEVSYQVLCNVSQLKGSRIFIYGSGKAGRDLRQRIEADGAQRKVTAFLDSYKTGRCDGIDIIRIDSYQHRPEDMIVISSTFYREMLRELSCRGITRFMVDPQFDFFQGERRNMAPAYIEEKILDAQDIMKFSGANIYLYGAGGAGKNFKNLIEKDYPEIQIAGFLDTYKAGFFEDKIVVKIEDYVHLKENIIIVTSSFYGEICKILSARGIDDYFIADSFWMFSFMFNPSEHKEKEADVRKISEMLFSETDRQLYNFMFQARSYNSGLARSQYLKDSDTTVMALVDPVGLRKCYPEHTGKQYLDFVNTKAIEIVVQAGVYDGNDILEISTISPKLKVVYGFDPSGTRYLLPPIFPMIDAKKVVLEKYGLYDKRTTVNFFPNKAGSFISETMTPVSDMCSIETISLDEYCSIHSIDHVDFICCDIEDAEIKFLEGAKNIILKSRPQMAISIYHSKGQFIEIPLLLQKMLENYVFRIGHYSDTLNETAIYAIPKELST